MQRETAELLEELCVDYLVDLCQNAMESAGPGNTVMPQDLLFCLRCGPCSQTMPSNVLPALPGCCERFLASTHVRRKDKEKYTKAVNLLEESAKIDEGKVSRRRSQPVAAPASLVILRFYQRPPRTCRRTYWNGVGS